MFGSNTPKKVKERATESLQHLRKADPVAIEWGDLHFTLKAPLARSDEENWLLTQAEYVREIKYLQEFLGVPILCTGDVFDKWNASAKLINYLIDVLPFMYAVPGQHDLPYHSWELLEDSGFATLIKAGKIQMLQNLAPLELTIGKNKREIEVFGFGWEKELHKYPGISAPAGTVPVRIAIIHKYCWTPGPVKTSYPGAPEDGRARVLAKRLEGFHVAAFGDNHIPFEWKAPKEEKAFANGPYIFNCGSFMRRKSDEAGLTPSVGVIFHDGYVQRYYLGSADNDRISNKDKVIGLDVEEILGNPDLIDAILAESKPDTPITFPDAIKHHLRNNKIGKHVKEIVLRALENG